jgi:hypothetical protein
MRAIVLVRSAKGELMATEAGTPMPMLARESFSLCLTLIIEGVQFSVTFTGTSHDNVAASPDWPL